MTQPQVSTTSSTIPSPTLRNARWVSTAEQIVQEFASITMTQAAEVIHRGVERGKARILVGPDPYLFDILTRVAPTHYYDLLGTAFGRLRSRAQQSGLREGLTRRARRRHHQARWSLRPADSGAAGSAATVGGPGADRGPCRRGELRRSPCARWPLPGRTQAALRRRIRSGGHDRGRRRRRRHGPRR